MHSCYTYQVILHDFIVLGIVSESQTQILPRPIERAEVKFSLIHFHLFSLWFPIVSYPNVLLLFFFFFFFLFFFFCFLFFCFFFPNPCHFENNFGLSVHIFVHFVTTFIISTLAIWVLDGQFVTNFVILYLSGSMKSIGHLLAGRLFRVFFFFFFCFFLFFFFVFFVYISLRNNGGNLECHLTILYLT